MFEDLTQEGMRMYVPELCKSWPALAMKLVDVQYLNTLGCACTATLLMAAYVK